MPERIYSLGHFILSTRFQKRDFLYNFKIFQYKLQITTYFYKIILLYTNNLCYNN